MSVFDGKRFMRRTKKVFLSSEEGVQLMKHENCVKVLDGRAKKKRSPISWKDTILMSEIWLEMDPQFYRV